MVELICPKCGSALGKLIASKGLPCPHCNIFFETAWGESEDGRWRQYLARVEDKKREKEEVKPSKPEAEKCPVAHHP